MRVVLLGPPGAGKGTQAIFLRDRFKIPQISSGDLLRAAIKAGTEVGRQAHEFMERGQLAPDSLVLDMISERLSENDAAAGFILDGFPRSQTQAEHLGKILGACGLTLDRVVAVDVPHDEIVRRISGRRTCTSCGAMFHVASDPPKTEGICDRCGAALIQRDDDREQTVRERLRVYAENTRPLIDYYRRVGIISQISGTGSPADVEQRIVTALSARDASAK
jgi:adenylate kinase